MKIFREKTQQLTKIFYFKLLGNVYTYIIQLYHVDTLTTADIRHQTNNITKMSNEQKKISHKTKHRVINSVSFALC